MEEHCAKITVEDGRVLYFSIKKSQTDNCNWAIILTDGSTVWNTKVTENDVKDMAVGSSYTADQFVDLFEMAFQLRPQDPDTILKYTLTSLSAGKDCFFWSIYLPNDDKTFRLGSLYVSPLSEAERGPVYSRMFDSLLRVTHRSKQQAALSQRDSEEQKAVSKQALLKLEKFVTVQEMAERDLYTNFVAVLNEKKRLIRELQDQCDGLTQRIQEIESVSDTISTAPVASTSSVPKKGRPSKRPTKKPTIQSSDDSEVTDVDEPTVGETVSSTSRPESEQVATEDTQKAESPARNTEVDDLLGISVPSVSKSPVRRGRMTRRAPAPPAAKPKPVKKAKTSLESKDSESLIDDLLGDM